MSHRLLRKALSIFESVRVRGRTWDTPELLRLLPLIAQRPALVRSTRLVAYCSDPSPVASGNRSRGARPLKVELYLICLNNKCFGFKPIICILILMVLNIGTPELWKGKLDKHRVQDFWIWNP